MAQALPDVSDNVSKLAPHLFFRFHQPQNIIKHTPRIHTIKLALMAPHQNFRFHQEKCQAEPSLQSVLSVDLVRTGFLC